MRRILRAFAWMRWRVLVNSLERTSARDTLERFSLAVEQLGPLLAAALFIPSALALAALGGYTGYLVATGPPDPWTFSVVRLLLLGVSGLCVLGPILFPIGERTNPVRLLLLPIPRRVLYIAQAAGAITDPWILLAIPLLAALPIGLAAGGALPAALLVLLAGALLIVVLVGLSALTMAVVHLVVRDRRRGELIALLFILVVPVFGILPAAFDPQPRRASRPGTEETRPGATIPVWMRDAGRRAFTVLPSELFTTATRAAIVRRELDAAPPVAALLATALALHGVAMLAFGVALDSPESSSRRRTVRSTSRPGVRLPGFSPGASAVALAHLRLALRTPRGRSILLSPLLVFGMFAVILHRAGGTMEFGFLAVRSGIGLATFGSAVCLLSILPFAMNQFAIDRAGLTLLFLSPLRDGEILAGKAAGNALIAAGPALLCTLIAYGLFPEGSLAVWVGIPLGVASAYLLGAPAAAALSAVFPRAVNLNSIGSGSNPHGLASVLGLGVFVTAGVPAILLAWVALRMLDRPLLVPVLLLVWCVVALGLCRVLFTPVRLLFARRRENLGLVGRTGT